MATYYANAARVMCQAGDLNNAENPTEFMRRTDGIGLNPFNHFDFDGVFTDTRLPEYLFCGYLPDATRSVFRSIVQRYYSCVAMDGVKQPTHFVEKCELDTVVRKNLQDLFPNFREIVLIRDLRDVYCSYRKYFAGPDSEFVYKVLGNAAECLERMAGEQRPGTVFLKYEDCMENPARFFRNAYEFLGIEDLSASTDKTNDSLFNRHATSESPAASVGRWRHELTADEIATLADACGEFFRVFGYDEVPPAGLPAAAEDHPRAVDHPAIDDHPGDAPIEAGGEPADAALAGLVDLPQTDMHEAVGAAGPAGES
jgi:hypothetical protein